MMMKNYLTILAVVGLALLAGCKKEPANTDNNTPVDLQQGVLPGLFSVDDHSTVAFSQGNLQFNPAAGKWRFAEEQFDVIGQSNEAVSAGYEGWIDLFGWGTSGYRNTDDPFNTRYLPWDTARTVVDTAFNYFGYGPSTNQACCDLVGASASYDWGVYNAISNGGGATGLWRVLSRQEWEYLLNERSASAVVGQNDVRYCMAIVNNQLGLMLFPDVYAHPQGVPSPQDCNVWMLEEVRNRYSIDHWRLLEAEGVVFLPCAGHRYGGEVINAGTYGSYWGSTCDNQLNAFFVAFKDQGVFTSHSIDRCFGHSVRLVR